MALTDPLTDLDLLKAIRAELDGEGLSTIKLANAAILFLKPELDKLISNLEQAKPTEGQK